MNQKGPNSRIFLPAIYPIYLKETKFGHSIDRSVVTGSPRNIAYPQKQESVYKEISAFKRKPQKMATQKNVYDMGDETI